jgi:hypothetical protein
VLDHLAGLPERFRFITAAALWRERFESGADVA